MLETIKGNLGSDKMLPDTEYVGVLSGDSITSQSVYTLGRYMGTQWSAENYVAQSLFRVECKLNYTKNENMEKLQQTLSKNPHKYDKLKWSEAMREARDEEQTNKAELAQKKGTPVQYGQIIQLKHLFTKTYITVFTQEISKEGGSQKISLTKGTEKAWFQFMPGTKTNKIGDLVRYGEAVIIMTKADNDNCYLHSSNIISLISLDTGKREQDDFLPESKIYVHEVNSSVQASTWKAKKCVDYNHMESKENVIKVGDMFKLYHVDTDSYLTLSKSNLNFNLMKTMKETGKATSLDVFLTNSQDNEAALCWELERVEDCVGGPANWDGLYKLRHVLTGLYLTYYIEGDFKLESSQNFKKTLIRMHPLNLIPGVFLIIFDV